MGCTAVLETPAAGTSRTESRLMEQLTYQAAELKTGR